METPAFPPKGATFIELGDPPFALVYEITDDEGGARVLLAEVKEKPRPARRIRRKTA